MLRSHDRRAQRKFDLFSFEPILLGSNVSGLYMDGRPGNVLLSTKMLSDLVSEKLCCF